METKKYYWIKLKKEFLGSEEIDFLLTQKNGSDYVVIYEMLCLLSSNNKGRLESSIGDLIVPYTIEKIQRETKYFNIDTIRVALELFNKLGLVYLDNGTIVISNIDSLVGSETKWANIKRIQREKNKGGLLVDNVQQEIRDKSKDKRIDKKDKKDKTILSIEERILNLLIDSNFLSSEDIDLELYLDLLKRLVELYDKKNIILSVKYFVSKLSDKTINNKFGYFKESVIQNLEKDYLKNNEQISDEELEELLKDL